MRYPKLIYLSDTILKINSKRLNWSLITNEVDVMKIMKIVMKIFIKDQSSVRFLVSGSGTWTTVLFGFASSWVSDQQSPVILKKQLLDLSFLCLVNELLVVGNDALGNCLSDCVNLSDITTSSDSDSDVKILESFKSE